MTVRYLKKRITTDGQSNLVIEHFDVFRRPVPKYFPYLKIAENGIYDSDITVVLNVIAIQVTHFNFFFFFEVNPMEIRTTKIAIPTFQYHKRTCRFNFDPN